MKFHFKSIALLFIVSLLVIGYFLPEFLFHPNSYLMAQGGDAYVIYYDMVYQVCQNPDYILFQGMNYPFGESILMTDAQAALSMTLKLVNEHFFSICDFVPGIVHLIILLLLPLTAVFLYFIFIELNISIRFSIVFSLLITFLAPQLQRITGHFGLAYPFVIPMVIYWFMIKYKSGNFQWKDLLFGSVLYFFFINNPYVGFTAGGLFVISAVLVCTLERNKKGVILVLTGIIPIILGYLTIKLSDPFDDRIITQWGFFYYFASIAGMFFPNGSLLDNIFHLTNIFGDVRFEGKINVGLVTTITLITIGFTYLSFKIFKRPFSLSIPKTIQYIFWGSLLMFVYAANYSLYGFAREFMEDHMGSLLMFKASGRLAWSFYYGLTILTVVILARLHQKYSDSKWSIWCFIVLPVLIWSYEDYSFLETKFDNVPVENLFNKDEIHTEISNLGIDKNVYEAMYLLPVIQTWNDKFLFELDFRTQRAAMTISGITGIPMINGMMSRAPLKSSISSIQLASNPAIKRQRLNYMKDEKPYLLIYGNQKQKPTEGEKLLLSRGKFLGELLGARLYTLNKSDFQGADINDSYNGSNTYIHNSWNEEESPIHLTSPGARKVQQGTQKLFSYDSTDTLFTRGENIEISLWHYTDYRNYRVPRLIAIADGKEHQFFNRSSYDYIGYWVRQSLIIPAPDSLVINSVSDYPVLYDDLHIQKQNDTTTLLENGILIRNNYPITEEDRFTPPPDNNIPKR